MCPRFIAGEAKVTHFIGLLEGFRKLMHITRQLLGIQEAAHRMWEPWTGTLHTAAVTVTSL